MNNEHLYQIDIEFAEFINKHCIGKTIKKAKAVHTFMAHTVEIEFEDNTKILISGENDEGFWAEVIE